MLLTGQKVNEKKEVNMKKITLSQLLQYLDKETTIQIVLYGEDWNAAEELDASSSLLKPFYDYTVTDIGCEMSYISDSPVIRVSVRKDIVTSCCRVLNFNFIPCCQAS